MYKKKSLFVTFEGIEGSGKTYQSIKLYNNIIKLGFKAIKTREPGGSKGAEDIRKLILSGSKNKFSRTTDTLLYLAARNEHIKNKIVPSIKKKINIICDRFIDSTIAYQFYGKQVSRNLIDNVHQVILKNVKPDITFILKLDINKALSRVKKRKTNNRYDKFSKSFYETVQKGFIKISKKNKKRYVVLDSSEDSPHLEKIILKKFLQTLNT